MSFASPLGGPIASAFVEVTADTTKADQAIRAFLRSLATDSVVAAERAGESITNSFQEAARQSNLALRDIGGVGTFAPVVAQAEVAGERIDNSFRDAARDSNVSLASIGRGAALFAGGVAVAGAAVVGFGVSSAAALEQTTIGFTSLLGSAEEADAFIREMQQFAATTPFEFQGLADNARRLLAVSEAIGITREELIPTIGTIGDLTAVLGAPPDAIDRVVRALGQMGSRGKVTTEEMLQLAEALPGFQPFQAMADGLGLTTAELQEQISAGTIPAKEGIDALLAGMREFPGAAGAMAAQAQTLTGVFSTFKDTVSLALTEAFGPLVPTITSTLTQVLPSIEATLGTVAPALSSLAGSLLGVLGDVLRELGSAFGVALQGFANGFAVLAERLGPALEPVSGALEALAPLFVAIGEAVAPLLNVFGELLGTVIPPLAQVLTGLTNNVIAPLVELLSGVLLSALEALQPVFGALEDVLTELFATLGPVIEEVATLVAGALTEAFEVLSPVLTEVVEVLGAGLSDVLVALAPVIRDLAAVFAERFQATIEALAPVLPELAEALVQIAVALADLLVAVSPLIILFTQLETVLIQRIGAPVLLAIAQAIAFLATQLANLVNLLVTGAGPALSAVGGALAAVGGAVQSVIGFLVDLWQGVLVPVGEFLLSVFAPVLGVLVALIAGPVVVAVATWIEVLQVVWHEVLEPIGSFLLDIFMPILRLVSDFLSTVFSVAVDLLGAAFGNLQAAVSFVGEVLNFVFTQFISPIASFIADVFTSAVDNLSAAWDALQGPIETVGDVISDVLGFIEDAVDAIGDLGDAIDNIPGVSAVSGLIGKIPGLQGGGLITDDTLAALHAPEVVIPLNDPQRALALSRASGLLDLLATAATPLRGVLPATSGLAVGGGGTVGTLTIGTISVTVTGPVDDPRRVGREIVTGVEDELRRKQVALAVRSL